MKAPQPTSFDQKELIPPGPHVARLYSLVSLGTQDGYKGKKQFKIQLTWELPHETFVFKEENGPEPRVISRTYAFSMYRNPKTGQSAPLRAMIESWRGKVFETQEDADGFDLEAMLGIPCTVNVLHQTSEANGKTYANVDTVTGLPKGTAVPEMKNRPMVYDIMNHDPDVFSRIPEWVQELIKKSTEWQYIISGQPLPNVATQKPEEQGDDLPF